MKQHEPGHQDAVLSSARRVLEVEAYSRTQPARATLPVVSGSVRDDRGAKVRRTVSLTAAADDAPNVPTGLGQVLAPGGGLVSVRAGVEVSETTMDAPAPPRNLPTWYPMGLGASASLRVSTSERDTVVYADGVEVARYEAPGTRSMTVRSGAEVQTSRPVSLRYSLRGYVPPRHQDAGRRFSFRAIRYSPLKLSVRSLANTTTRVTVYLFSTLTPSLNIEAADFSEEVLVPAGRHVNHTLDLGALLGLPASFNTSVFVAADQDVVCQVEGTSGDYLTLRPEAVEVALGRPAGAATATSHDTTGGLTALPGPAGINGSVYRSAAGLPFALTAIADGGGGDAEQGVPVETLGDAYLLDHNVRDFSLVMPGGGGTVTVQQLDAQGSWATVDTFAMQALADGPGFYSSGDQSGNANDLTNPVQYVGATRWLGSQPFLLRTNDDQGRDEYNAQGWTQADWTGPHPRTEVRRDLVPLGVFDVAAVTVSHTPDGRRLQVRGEDLSRRVARGRLTTEFVFQAGTSLAEVLEALVDQADPGLLVDFAPATEVTVPLLAYEVGADAWDACRRLADAHGFRISFDSEGVCRLETEEESGPLRADLALSEGGLLLSAERTLDDQRAYTQVVVTGEPLDGATPVRAIADTGAPSAVPYFFSSPLIRTQAQAQAAAESILARVRRGTDRVVLRCLPFAPLEAGDLVSVESELVAGLYRVDSVAFPFQATAPMTVQASRVE